MTVENAPPSFECDYYGEPCNWLYLGSSGRALTFWKLYHHSSKSDPIKAQWYLSLAKQYIDGALSRVSNDFDDFISFVNGNPGVFSIASVIYDTLGLKTEAMEFVEKVNQVFSKPITNKTDYDDGIPGFLYAIDFLESYYGKQLFARSDVTRYAMHLFEFGFSHKLDNGTLMFPEPLPDTRNSIGFGRGTTGILFRLL